MKQKKITLLNLGGVVFKMTGPSNSKVNWDIIRKIRQHAFGQV